MAKGTKVILPAKLTPEMIKTVEREQRKFRTLNDPSLIDDVWNALVAEFGQPVK